jgi:hypothetical protein
MTREHQTRARNPFRELMVTELIENPKLYRKMFSEQILIGETLTVFRPINAVLLGPQGSGKSMILNLLRYSVLAEYVAPQIHEALDFLTPFLGISINLQRAYFQAFGRRSAATPPRSDPDVDASCAADYLNHSLFCEFLKGLRFLLSPQGEGLARWMRVGRSRARLEELAGRISQWKCWYGFYEGSRTVDELLGRCENRINAWRQFLNTTSDDVSPDIWKTKTMIGEPLHYMGNLLQEIVEKGCTLPLYVVIDQYEVLPELNPTHGTTLQRVVNTLIKSRDPVVFYRIGARTYDWGKELRVWGAESRVELQRDYVVIDLTDALMRNENTSRSTFKDLATDVAAKRLQEEGGYAVQKGAVEALFGPDSPEEESWRYLGGKRRNRDRVLGRLPKEFYPDIERFCGHDASPLERRLASAWIMQRLRHGDPTQTIRHNVAQRPWREPWWRKERVLPALCQIASLTRSKKHYAGWRTIVDLSGANIAAFLLLASEIWDMATKFGHEVIDAQGQTSVIPRDIQGDGIRVASSKWVQRDRTEFTGGSKRYAVLTRLGPAIHDAVVEDQAISNPGHTGFSMREIDIDADPVVRGFLRDGVSWAILEERPHTSKNSRDMTRRKFYLHPLLSPTFEIPHRRTKEPLYITLEQAIDWFTTNGPIRFTGIRRYRQDAGDVSQSRLPF